MRPASRRHRRPSATGYPPAPRGPRARRSPTTATASPFRLRSPAPERDGGGGRAPSRRRRAVARAAPGKPTGRAAAAPWRRRREAAGGGKARPPARRHRPRLRAGLGPSAGAAGPGGVRCFRVGPVPQCFERADLSLLHLPPRFFTLWE